MEVGVGLPATVPGVSGAALVDWAVRAERHGLASLGVLDRLVYDNVEPLIALAVAAGVTNRIRLTTSVLLPAYRAGVAALVKQLWSVNRISGGRLVLGVAAGNREDDHAAEGTRFTDRGRRLDAFLSRLGAAGDAPQPVDPGSATRPPVRPDTPPILVGGHSAAAMRRAARFGTGWIAGGSAALPYPQMVAQLRSAWTDAGRTDRPRLVSLCYFALGPDAVGAAREYVNRYYAHAGPYAGKVLASVATDATAVRRVVAERAAAGGDEVLFFPCRSDPAQVEMLAAALG
ncbi:LLM class flavin-dependent oxidoreductase [Plantactinospora siamensis]|uniref:LLM class flavin-dependent oxidoreductase n=1 Tax=Plantactinospora siamensis TaxID=555372 RepID=A0ABV6NWP1_9ACTN